MTGIITKRKILRTDQNNWDGKTLSKTATDSTGGTITDLAVGNEVDVLEVYGSGTSYTNSTISTAISAIGSSSVTLVFAPGAWTISDDLSIPANFACHIPSGCVFSVDSGKTLTFLGPTVRESATWTAGSGTVTTTIGSQVVVHHSDLSNTSDTAKGDALIGVKRAATGAVATTLHDWIEATAVSVMDMTGCDNTGATSSIAAFQAASDAAEYVIVPSGTYDLDDRWLITNANTTIFMQSNVTLNVSGWAYPGSQTPFGNQIHFTADDCAVLGSGKSSLIQITGGSDANGIGALNAARLTISNLTLDGGKSGVTAIVDDTFQSGISLINSTGSTANHTIDNVIVRNWAQYGINLYGTLNDGTTISNSYVYSNGIAAEALSVGAGIVATAGVKNLTISNTHCYSNKYHGIFGSSAGTASSNINIIGGSCHNNTQCGLSWTEESGFSSISGVGTTGINVIGGSYYSNASSGIKLGTYDSVGILKNVSVVGATVRDNTAYGVLVQTNNHATDRTSLVVLTGNTMTGNDTGLYIGANNISVYDIGNIISGNVTADVVDASSQHSFTPVLYGSTAAGVGTYTSQLGTYSKVGDRCFFDIILDWSAHTGTGNLLLSGLPYTSSSEEPQGVAFCQVANGVTVTGQVMLLVNSGTTTGAFNSVNDGTTAALALDTAGLIRCSGSYRVY